ncbi:MAG: hypothetical protein IJU37_07085 [Desulfovibrio sp.]|nr:hypothetical protein [Desulfovibrio sp.]
MLQAPLASSALIDSWSCIAQAACVRRPQGFGCALQKNGLGLMYVVFRSITSIFHADAT